MNRRDYGTLHLDIKKSEKKIKVKISKIYFPPTNATKIIVEKSYLQRL
jgi:hypothetical protein